MHQVTLTQRRLPTEEALTRSPYSVEMGSSASFGAVLRAEDCASVASTELRTTQRSSDFFRRWALTSFSLSTTARRWSDCIRMEAKRLAVDDLSGTDFEPGVAQNWAQFFVSEKSDEANLLKTSGEPRRTRTCNPLIKSQLLYH